MSSSIAAADSVVICEYRGDRACWYGKLGHVSGSFPKILIVPDD